MEGEKLSIEELEGLRPTLKNLDHVSEMLGYESIEFLLANNEGAVEAVMDWLLQNHQAFPEIEGYRNRDRVVLLANEMEGWEEEPATVVAYEGRGIYLVEVDHPIGDGEDPDGLREVTRDQMRRAT